MKFYEVNTYFSFIELTKNKKSCVRMDCFTSLFTAIYVLLNIRI